VSYVGDGNSCADRLQKTVHELQQQQQQQQRAREQTETEKKSDEQSNADQDADTGAEETAAGGGVVLPRRASAFGGLTA